MAVAKFLLAVVQELHERAVDVSEAEKAEVMGRKFQSFMFHSFKDSGLKK